MKTALITGINGQDGAFLAKLLLEKGYNVFGGDRRRSSIESSARLKILGIDKDIQVIPFDLLEYSNIIRVVDKLRPDEIYNLAAQSFVKTSFDQPVLTSEVDGLGVLKVLEAIRLSEVDTKFYQASTSEMFGLVQAVPQNEETPFYPRSPYGVAKLYSHWIVKNYRESYGMFACSGILFNHESELRGLEFVTKKIVNQAVKIYNGIADELLLGNLDSRRDWGHAEDYVYGMYLMLQANRADDYVLATGVTTTIRDFATLVFARLGIELSWSGQGGSEVGVNSKTGKVIIRVDPKFYRPAEVDLLVGDSTKAETILGWKPKITLEQLVGRMLDFELAQHVH